MEIWEKGLPALFQNKICSMFYQILRISIRKKKTPEIIIQISIGNDFLKYVI